VNGGLLLFQMAETAFGALLLFQSEIEVNRLGTDMAAGEISTLDSDFHTRVVFSADCTSW
jgi:hypothetical protein